MYQLEVVPWLRRLVASLSPRRHGFAPGSVHVGFVVHKVTLGQVFLRILRFCPVCIIPPGLLTIYHMGDEQYILGGRSSELVSPHRLERVTFRPLVDPFLLHLSRTLEGSLHFLHPSRMHFLIAWEVRSSIFQLQYLGLLMS
jgi:hypothetical protein